MSNLSFQLYSSRKFPPLDATLSMLAELGYSQAEGFGALYPDPGAARELRTKLDATGLSMTTGHMALELIEKTPDTAVEIARTLGLQSVFIPFVAPDDRPGNTAGWRAFAQRIETAGQPLRDAGLVTGYHNHDFEFADLGDGQTPMALILDHAPSLVWEIDIAWVVRGGQDPVAWIARYADRIDAAHIKDIAAAGEAVDEDGWADIGHGIMDWTAIAAALKATPVRHWVLEHDNPADHRRFAQRSLAFARKFRGNIP